MNMLTMLAWKGFSFAFGMTGLVAVYTTAILKDGALWAKDTKEEKEQLDIAQQKFWSLDREPIPGFRHDFFTTSKGTKLHFVVNANADTNTVKNVAIFIHGFPDSYVLWEQILQFPELQRTNILIAVDLPGYGGSDGLPGYGPNDVLEAITEYIVGMRKAYLRGDKKIVLVTHDWGTLIGARLAAETQGLADHFVLASAFLPGLTRYNTVNGITLAKQMLHTWLRQPRNMHLLRNAFSALSPILTQFRRSFYIFSFNLPWPFSMVFSTFGNYWFLRILHNLGKGKPKDGEQIIGRLNPKEAGEAMAITTGPGEAQLNDTGDTLKYGESVRKRFSDRGMSEKIRIYREGLFQDKWEKSLELTASLFELHDASASRKSSATITEGAMQNPITLMIGEHDTAFDLRLAFNDIKEFLVPGSQVLLIKGVGHWVPIEPGGRQILEKTIMWALDGDTKTATFDRMSDVRVVASV